MKIFDKLITIFFKVTILLTGIVIASIPIIYLLGNQSIYHQQDSASFLKFQSRSAQVEKIRNFEISNIYLRGGAKKLGWSDVNQTYELANYICAQFQKQNVVVVRKNLQFKEPKKTRADAEYYPVNFTISERLDETPVLQWLKIKLEDYISFQHQSLKQKQWVIVVFGDLTLPIAEDIKELKKENQDNKFLIVSTWPVSNKGLKIEAIALNGVDVEESTVPAGESEEVEESNKVTNDKQGKEGKKQKKYKVKKVKEQKEQKTEVVVETKNQSSDKKIEDL